MKLPGMINVVGWVYDDEHSPRTGRMSDAV